MHTCSIVTNERLGSGDGRVMEENDVTKIMTMGAGHSPCREMHPETVGTYTLGPRAPACVALSASDIPLATPS